MIVIRVIKMRIMRRIILCKINKRRIKKKPFSDNNHHIEQIVSILFQQFPNLNLLYQNQPKNFGLVGHRE